MKHDIKQEIINTARNLFIEYGYNGVSMRDIASAMKISPGNLTYHFRRKEDIAEAVVLLSTASRPSPLATATNMRELDDIIARAYSVLNQNTFYFMHYSQLAQISETVEQLQIKALSDINRMWSDTLDNLQRAGLIKPPIFPEQYADLAKVIQIISISWAQYDKRCKEAGTISFRDSIFGVIIPVLTDEGLAELRELRQCQPSVSPK